MFSLLQLSLSLSYTDFKDPALCPYTRQWGPSVQIRREHWWQLGSQPLPSHQSYIHIITVCSVTTAPLAVSFILVHTICCWKFYLLFCTVSTSCVFMIICITVRFWLQSYCHGYWYNVTLTPFPGLPYIQLLIACTMWKQRSLFLHIASVKGWRQGRPGNEAIALFLGDWKIRVHQTQTVQPFNRILKWVWSEGFQID